MKLISDEYFARMKMMENYFLDMSKIYPSSLPEYNASYEVNKIIESTENLIAEDLEIIAKIMFDVDLTSHKNDAHWYDYKIHVGKVLAMNEYTGKRL